jgi:hypothetical protein
MEVRALLGLMRENEAEAQSNSLVCQGALEQMTADLMILDPVVGEPELIKAVAEELAKFRNPWLSSPVSCVVSLALLVCVFLYYRRA